MLEIRNLDVHYRGIQALRGVSLHVKQGEIFALIGPNGAGKSSLVNALSGLVPTGGEIRFEGQPLGRMPAHLRSRAGIIQVPEGRRVIAPLSVAENLELGRQAAGVRGSDAQDLERVHALFPVLKDRRHQLSGSLSGGQQQMLAIGRALMARPRVLMLDEPSLGLAPVIIKEVFRALVQLNREGMTILLVEQNARLALQTAHRAAVLEQGRIVHEGMARELANDPVIADHYFGRAGLIA
ncbi:ABC transporter ATP-binding protein [Variovorax sp.]|jgi:branched-chain amino acid transport system ATP-binding protein|uniref:ABC transporter ATP-binding protein n=1 Tax=Variovorax sp. TaxID=1871043 RepID=UPI0012238E3C|nr:ABC transporter ATP-binding protein [Variovorax sp.]TAJ58799.1 MAG: ABC transporter ATP-binding protein [Variovorax sp.]